MPLGEATKQIFYVVLFVPQLNPQLIFFEFVQFCIIVCVLDNIVVFLNHWKEMWRESASYKQAVYLFGRVSSRITMAAWTIQMGVATYPGSDSKT